MSMKDLLSSDVKENLGFLFTTWGTIFIICSFIPLMVSVIVGYVIIRIINRMREKEEKI
ncbi:hypothetical protein EBI_25742 [Enterocytozoon bieneusi H348]|nr:hypothetical protein EBI_25742 [Enterocytozoon bieneusi H348]|eukprot:XP_002650423.1 hypothetical protein EBI_25742 [Enterocytozoon bieneusi H348]